MKVEALERNHQIPGLWICFYTRKNIYWWISQNHSDCHSPGLRFGVDEGEMEQEKVNTHCHLLGDTQKRGEKPVIGKWNYYFPLEGKLGKRKKSSI